MNECEAKSGVSPGRLTEAGPRICDSHHHMFDLTASLTPRLPPGVGARYSGEELLDDIGEGLNVEKTVVVESWKLLSGNSPARDLQPADETASHDSVAHACDERYGSRVVVAAGIVGYVDLTRGDAVVPILDAHVAASRRLRGVRQIASWDASCDIHSGAPAGLLLDPKFREGFGRLAGHNLSFDAMVYHTQLGELADLARCFPEVTIVVEHTGCPLGVGPYAIQRKRVFEEWRQGMAALAFCPNVVVKLGGLGMPVCGFGWATRPTRPSPAEMAESFAPYFTWCIERFGTDRCMFESNFPIEKASCTYAALWSAFMLVASALTDAERDALFYRTAVRSYALSPSADGSPRMVTKRQV